MPKIRQTRRQTAEKYENYNFFKKFWLRSKRTFGSSLNAVIAYICISAIVISLTTVGVSAIMNHQLVEGSETVPSGIKTPEDLKGKSTSVLILGIADDHGTGDILPDVIMVVNFNFEDNKISIIQIPRDSYVGSKVVTGKLNAVYSTAPAKQRVSTIINKIHDMLKINIDHYVDLKLTGFRKMIDKIGGIECDIPYRIKLETTRTITLQPGLQTLNGDQAECLVRTRKTIGGGADTDRLNSQKVFMKALLKKFIEKPNTIIDVMPTLLENVVTDMKISDVLSIASAVKRMMNTDAMDINTLPGDYATVGGLSVYTLSASKTAALLNDHFRLSVQEPILVSDLNIAVPSGNSSGGSSSKTSSKDDDDEGGASKISKSSSSSEASSDTSTSKNSSDTTTTTSTSSTVQEDDDED